MATGLHDVVFEMNLTDDDDVCASDDVLTRAFWGHKRDTQRLLEIKSKTVKCYNEIKHTLSKSLQQRMGAEGVVLLSKQDQSKIERVNQKPSLIFIGQTNSGKSSLINMMLGGTYVAAKQTPSTARLVKLTYGKKQRVRIINRDGTVLEEKILTKKTIPRKWIELDEKQRRDPKVLGSYIVAEVDNAFLASGIEVVDSPGLKENDELDKMVLNELKTIVPFVVYVLDGKNQLTNQDREDIKKVQAITKNIFYVVTKVDKDDDDDDDDDDEADVVLEKKSRAYKSLVREGYLPSGVKMEDCERFHGISTWRVKEYRKQGRRGRDPFVQDYYRFQQCLCDFVKSSLDSIMLVGSKLLLASLKACLDFFIRRATESKGQQRQFRQKIGECRQQENKIYTDMASKIRNKKSQISRDISAGVKACNDGIIRDASGYHFTDVSVPQDGVVNNGEILKQCQTQMEEFVMTKLCTEISAKLNKTFKEEDSILADLVKVVDELEKEQPDHEVSEILRLCTMSSYVVKNAISLEKASWKLTIRKTTRKALQFMKHPFDTIRGNVHVNEQ